MQIFNVRQHRAHQFISLAILVSLFNRRTTCTPAALLNENRKDKMFTRFGRQIFKLYESRPLLMNSIIGGTVYVAGEYTVQTQQKDVRFFNVENWLKLGQLGALGAAENGLVMMNW